MPSLLFVTTNWWPSLARLVHLFQQSGCRVSVLCPPQHPARAVPQVTIFPGEPFHPMRALSKAIAASEATILIPGDDRAVAYLHQLHEIGTAVQRALVERSLGDPGFYRVIRSRFELLERARSVGMDVPTGARINSLADLRCWSRANRAPWMVKLDGASHGVGVRIVHSLSEAERAYRQLSSRRQLPKAVKHFAVNRDPFLLADIRLRSRTQVPQVSVQSYVRGYPGNLAMFCQRGEVLAATVVDAVACWGETGPTTIVRPGGASEVCRGCSGAGGFTPARRVLWSRLHGR